MVDEGSGATAKVSVEKLRQSRWTVPVALAASLQAEWPAGILVLCLSSQWTQITRLHYLLRTSFASHPSLHHCSLLWHS